MEVNTMKTRLFLFICLSALALQGFTAALAGGVDLPLSSSSSESRALAAGLDIEATLQAQVMEELDSYNKELPPLSIWRCFVYPDVSPQSSAEIAGLITMYLLSE
jgi:hypothetical protein